MKHESGQVSAAVTAGVACMLLSAAFAMASSRVHAGPLPGNCSAPGVIETSAITLVGEIHGTVETPAWVADVACGLSRRGEVVVVLEIPNGEQHRIDAFMKSAAAPADRAALIAGPFWKGQDGRASKAMIALIERMRSLAADGAKVRVVAVDDWKGGGSSRDAAMAAAIRELRTDRPQAKIIALMGNLHARSSPKDRSNGPADQPAGYLLRDLQPLTVLADFDGGAAWVCSPNCGPRVFKTHLDHRRPPGFHAGESPRPGYLAVVNLGLVTASPPVSQRKP